MEHPSFLPHTLRSAMVAERMRGTSREAPEADGCGQNGCTSQAKIRTDVVEVM